MKNKKSDKRVKILNKNLEENDDDGINIIKRTLENNTHEVISDMKLKKITSWRKSKTKFLNNLVYNILSLGILHLISLCYPNLYIKLYCIPWPAKECDYFLVENVYGQFTLCLKIYKKGTSTQLNYNSYTTKDNIDSSFSKISIKTDTIKKNLTYSFTYKSMTYEYNEDTNEIIPVYLNLSKMKNKDIINYFSEGLSSQNIVNKYKERYGLNEYIINLKLFFIYFKKSEIPTFIIVLIIGVIELILLKNYLSLFVKCGIILIILFIQFSIIKKIIISKYRKEYTLDGEDIKIKVKRKYLIKNNELYAEINNYELLPGDIVFLKENDFVPCDCIIIEGECIANQCQLSGSLDAFRKTSIENNNEIFSYKHNNINILYHGMKIVKIFSKFNNGFISVLCINTGPNTFKANQYTNILYKLERKKEYNETYNFFGHRKKYIFIYMILVFFLSFLFGGFYLYKFRLSIIKDNLLNFGYKILVRILCKSLNSVFFITHNIIIFVNLYRLQKENIICFDKSRLINSGKINTIIFSKTGTLCYDSLEINSFHPLNFNAHKSGYISFKSYPCDKSKEMSMQLLRYYQGYLNKTYDCKDSLLNSNAFKAQSNQLLNKLNMKSEEYCTLFIECLVTCNNIEKFNIEIFGNNIETAIFNEMKWDMKCYDSNSKENGFSKEINNNDTFFIDDKCILIQKKICDIFPRNYFKITEASSKETKTEQRNKLNNACMMKQSKKLYISKNSNNFSQNNQIEKDLSKSYIYSYKLRIYKKFIKNGALNSGAIVYNFMTKELRFMIKGMPEDILEKCDKNLFPENLENIISFYRRNGLVIIVYATKKINLDEYKDLNDLDYYMNNLTLCGFITLKSKLKEETISSIQDLKEFDCNLIMASGDNVFNCLSVGIKSGILDNKNVYAFDIDNDTSKIIIRKINSNKSHNKEKEDSRTDLSDKYSKQSASIYTNQKESSLGKSNNSIIRTSKTKKFNSNLANEFKDNKALHTPQIKLNKGSFVRKLSIKNYKKISKILSESPENEKIDNTAYNSEAFDINKEKGSTSKNSNLSRSPINNESRFVNRNLITRNKIKYELKQIQENTSLKKSKNKTIRNINKYIFDFEKYYYYNGIFRDYEELNDNCIYCISGKAFSFLYENKKKKECKYLLEKIHKNCKVFFEMSSIDKTCSIDFFREHQNTTVCNIGECESDFDSIITSNVGITIKNPTNINTILCHFYYSNSNISCIKNIILEGRVLLENNILLEKVSFLCSMTLNSYILCCLIRNVDSIESQLNFLEIEYLILAIFSLSGEPKNGSILVEPLAKNRKLLSIYYIIEIIGVLLVKLSAIYLFSYFYRSDFSLDIGSRDLIFVTFYFSLCIEFLVSIIYSLNLNSFNRKSPFSNIILIFLTLLLFIYLVIIVCLSSSNMKYDLLRITYFEFSSNLIDSFSDKNKIYLLIALMYDFVGSFILSTIIYYIFRLIAKMKLPKADVK